MTERKRLLRLITKNYIENALTEIEEIERKRKSCPKVELTNIELEALIGISQGRNRTEVEAAIKSINNADSYASLVTRLFRKFEAFTLAHVVYKAVKMGII